MAEETGIVFTSTGESDKTFVVPSMAYSIGATGLTPDTTYNVTAYYTNAQGSTIYTPQATEFKTLPEVKDDWFGITNTSKLEGTVSIIKYRSPSYTPNLEYSLDGVRWTGVNISGGLQKTLSPNATIYFRGDNPNGFNRTADTPNYYFFNCDVEHCVSGNLCTLFDPTMSVYTIPDSCFTYLFARDNTMTGADGLHLGDNNVTAGNWSFNQTFASCSGLLKGMDLSKLTSCGLKGISGIYYQCSSLNYAVAPNVATWDESKSANWLASVSGSGTVAKPATLEIPSGKNGVPAGWSTINY